MTTVPDLSEGLCLSRRARLPAAAWDAGAAPDMREAAVHACRVCPVLAPCREWAVAAMLGLYRFDGIIGGWTRGQIEAERARRRRAERDAEPPAA